MERDKEKEEKAFIERMWRFKKAANLTLKNSPFYRPDFIEKYETNKNNIL